ncbi:TonB-dependent Receptor Plug Domain [Granulicella pectinivorans]|uniref:TonB-dependent Receptor Plug Domain n=1 Tax=Granulicella pectinivorans TaxID=474950 RepID=A0A1I6M4A1_9BACT|nr:carboxypeptidase regulatory-like domain-containing protein [Granulicella pectinivorans]SFS10499.1 TonB-dependent Receptor Plug Domain [Granulicella pectinivorans]
MQSRFIRHLSLMLLLAVCCCVSAFGQTITGSVNGTVTDPSGAVVPNAKATATNIDTNVATSSTTNKDGIYNIRFLQIGNYKVTISAPGFATATYGPFVLETAQDAKIDSKLTLEGTQQNVSIQSEVAPLLNTENSTLATTLDSRAIENIPMVSRDIVSLTMFLPGSVSTSPNGFVGQAAITQGGNTVSINGNRQQTNQYILDGVNINETLNDTPGYNPSVDAIGQVQIVSANASAEYGNVLGGDVLYTTKSGTNQWHGSAFYFLSDGKLNANTWANKYSTPIVARSGFTRNIFGGTFGGPIFKDKLFFFADYQGGRYHTGGPATATVLTAKERTGDFSELLNPVLMCSKPGTTCNNSKLIQLYDATNPGTAYANNKINITNPAAIYLFQHPELYPLPNQLPSASNSPASANYLGFSKNRSYGDQFDVKVDWKASSKDAVSVRYTQSANGSTSQSPLPTTFTSAPTNPVKGVAINEVHTFNSSMVNEFRAGYTRIQNLGAVLLDRSGAFGLNGNSLLGINATQAFAGFAALSFSTPASPAGITLTNGSEYTGLGNSNTGTNFTDNTFLYGDNFTWQIGRHTLKAGVQFQRQQQNNFYPGNDGSMGGFYYLGAGTANTATPDANGFTANGYTAADFLLNRASFVSKGGVSGPAGMRSWRDGYFLQDDWKITPSFTANIGVRYEYDQPIYEVHNHMSTIDPANPSVILLDGTPQARAAGFGRGLVNPYYGSVMPRVGFNYAATPKLVVRGGYGIQNFMEGTGANLRMTTNLPFQSTYEASGTQVSTTNPGNFFTVQSGFTAPANAAAASGAVYNVWNKNIKPAFIGEYSLATEYQLNRTSSLQIAYLGESGQHLVTANARNQLHNPCIINGAPVPVSTPTPPAACLTQAPAPFYTTPGVGYNGTIRYTDSNAMMNYNALQASFRQRAWHGLQYTVNYTYSKAMTNSTGFYGVPSISASSAYAENVYDLHSEYGPTGQDVRHGLNFNGVYDLPVGRGRMFGANMPVYVDEVVGGWKIGMTGIAYSGFPITLVASNNSMVNGNSQRANHYRTLKIVNRSAANWFGTDPSAIPCTTAGVDNGVCAYGQPAAGTFGTARPDSERVPSYQTYGASITKDFRIWHEQAVNFRADADNLLNSAYLSNPGNNVTSTSFGVISSARSGPRNLQLSVKYHF